MSSETSVFICPLCGCSEFEHIDCINWLVCRSCTLQFPREMPNTGAVTNQFPSSPSGRPTRLARRQADLATLCRDGRSVLDIGCGNGSFLHAMRFSCPGISLTGVEVDPDSSNAAKDAGLTILNSVPQKVQGSLITLWHVGEHFRPPELLDILKSVCDETNLLLISVPNGDSISWRYHGDSFAFFDSHSHMVQYTKQSLERLLNQSGWSVQSYLRTPMYGMFNAIQTTLNLDHEHNSVYHALKRGGKRLTINMILRSMVSMLRHPRPLMRMLLAERHPELASSLTVLAAPGYMP